MRAVECPCGEHVEAKNDEALIQEVRRHADEEHPNRYQESEIRVLVTTGAYDSGR